MKNLKNLFAIAIIASFTLIFNACSYTIEADIVELETCMTCSYKHKRERMKKIHCDIGITDEMLAMQEEFQREADNLNVEAKCVITNEN